MTLAIKTIVATGLSSGLGFEALKQLLEQPQPYRIIFGARNTEAVEDELAKLQFDRESNGVNILPLDLSNIKGVKPFAEQVLEKLGQDKIDYLLLNAAISNGAEKPGPHGSKWCESFVVNHLSQHYLVHLLREKLEKSSSRIVVVSSGAIRIVPDPSTLDKNVKGASGADGKVIYPETKFAQLLGAHWWRRQLQGKCRVIAVSPGLIPNTGLGRGGSGMKLSVDLADAKSVLVGAQSILAAFTHDEFPEDPEQIFLTSWDKWCPSKEEIERDENIV